MTRVNVSVASTLACNLGEGLHWDKFHQLLWLVDVIEQEVIAFDPRTMQVLKREVPEPIGWVMSVENTDLLLVGLKSGLAILDAFSPQTALRWVDRTFPGDENLRLNDAKLDSHGRLWCGSMSLSESIENVGALARFDFETKTWTIIDSEYTIPNGPAINQDSTLILHNDSGTLTTYRYEIDPFNENALNRTIWRQFTEDDGLPDGMTFDSEGYVWIAHWGTGQVRRYDPAGEIDFSISLPTSNVTNVCFGGKDLDRLFVTTARRGLGDSTLAAEPLAGSLFEIRDTGVAGFPPNQVLAQPLLQMLKDSQ